MEEGDFPGRMKPLIDACFLGEKFNDGKLKLKKGEVYESWSKEGVQFFIAIISGNYFMGVDLGLCSDNGLSLIADEVEKEINCRYFLDFPAPGLTVKRITMIEDKEEEHLSFIFNLSLLRKSAFCNRSKNSETEKKLDEALEEFKRKCSASFPR